MYILAIETSCDETGAAVINNNCEILSNIVSSQIDLHSKYGGVVPEVACRKHLEVLNPVIQEALDKAGICFKDLKAVACANRPGLIGAVLMGVGAAKAISAVCGIPLIAVDHLESHIYANFIEHKDIEFPLVALIVSGGHTSLIYIEDHLKYEILGRTRDDAAGEAFDKVAKALNLGYPGGPKIDELAKKGNEKAISFPKAKLPSPYEFSFSGLKTAVMNFLHKDGLEKHSLPDICASFQKAVVEVLIDNTFKAADDKGVKQILLSGGVVANSSLRKKMEEKAKELNFKLNFPPIKYCTDNAAMTAACAYYKYNKGIFADLSLDAYSTTGM
ncbi:MAG: tRNA (adenosine(37)-N6)-threonylcarbamoyltransferase complex transferase subunit TsaD [Armatimonadota bacterium]